MFSALAALIVMFTWAIRRSVYGVPAVAVLNTLVFLCVFENMLAFTGMVMQLFWMLVFAQFFPRPRKTKACQDRHQENGDRRRATY
ncbi:hypothetical protein [Ralstonia mannitolilytica]|uniref:hypothetical protein n=1 Tax=Ralstonia mannitolilytica TaxID=105219 RepID=UPI002930B566|nr:hypothetical protein [Ralstonia mannitolilytica]